MKHRLPRRRIWISALLLTVGLVAHANSTRRALTLCLPGVGPVTVYTTGSRNTELNRLNIEAHEQVHRAECREVGALAYAKTALAQPDLLAVEMKGVCAEVRATQEFMGSLYRPEHKTGLVEETIDTKRGDTRRDEAVRVARDICPELEPVPLWGRVGWGGGEPVAAEFGS